MPSTITTSLAENICELFTVWASDCFSDLPAQVYTMDTVPEQAFDIDLSVVIAPIEAGADYETKGVKPFSGEILKTMTLQIAISSRNLYNTDPTIPGLFSLEEGFIRYVEEQKIYYRENVDTVGWYQQSLATSLLLRHVKYDFEAHKKVAYLTYETLPLSFYNPIYANNATKFKELILNINAKGK